VSDNSGVEDRLKNLGYFKGGLTGGLNDESKAALKRFQKANGLPVTGEPDPETKDALLARHGS
jgi:peptidoglycan hydrolase-like protein with peptidoglycan-binding domain